MLSREKERRFIEAAKTLLDARVDRLDGRIRARLRVARRKALEAGRRPATWRLPATRAAAAAAALLALFLLMKGPAPPDNGAIADIEDLELLAAPESLDFYEDLESMGGWRRTILKASAWRILGGVFLWAVCCTCAVAEEADPPPDMALLEFLGSWETENGEWVNPILLDNGLVEAAVMPEAEAPSVPAPSPEVRRETLPPSSGRREGDEKDEETDD